MSEKRCPECGGPMVDDWEGDPNVINGTRNLLTCLECGISMVDEDSPLGVTERLFNWARQQGLHPPQEGEKKVDSPPPSG